MSDCSADKICKKCKGLKRPNAHNNYMEGDKLPIPNSTINPNLVSPRRNKLTFRNSTNSIPDSYNNGNNRNPEQRNHGDTAPIENIPHNPISSVSKMTKIRNCVRRTNAMCMNFICKILGTSQTVLQTPCIPFLFVSILVIYLWHWVTIAHITYKLAAVEEGYVVLKNDFDKFQRNISAMEADSITIFDRMESTNCEIMVRRCAPFISILSTPYTAWQGITYPFMKLFSTSDSNPSNYTQIKGNEVAEYYSNGPAPSSNLHDITN